MRDGERVRRLRVTGLDADGQGTASVKGVEVTVPGALPGEDVEAAGPPDRRGRVRLVRVLTPSPHRVAPRCRHFGECGGCAWQHVAYAEQLRLKRERVQYLLDAELGDDSVRVAATVPTPPSSEGDDTPWHFRAKVHFAFDHDTGGRVVMGHMRRSSREVFDAAECPVHAEAGNALAFAVRDVVARADAPCGPPPRGVVRHLVVRVAQSSSEVLATVVASRPHDVLRRVAEDVMALPAAPDGLHLNMQPGTSAMLFGRETACVAGRERLRDAIGGVTFLMSATAFFQTNVAAAGRLLDLVMAAVGERPTTVLDLYAGLGLFALPLARRGHQVLAVEENPQAVEDGTVSAAANGIDATRCRFVRSKVEYAIKRVMSGGRQFDAVILDPPRTGAHPAVLRAIAERVVPGRIVYVSCDPEALARDLAQFTAPGGGYRLRSVTPLDMFPHTTHIETVAVLDRRASPERGRR